MTVLESSRATVLRFCECLSRRDFAGMAALSTSDATWWVVGRPDYFSMGGLHSLKNVLQIIDGFVGSLDEFSFTAQGSIAEGNRVAIEAISSGRKGAAHYSNTYLMRYELHGGKIHSIREFFDPYEISAFLGQRESQGNDLPDDREGLGDTRAS